MPDKDDHLSNEVSISAKLENNAVTAATRSRFVSAVDRLLGALADVPTAWLEVKAAKIRERDTLSTTEKTESLPSPHVQPLLLTNAQRIEKEINSREARKYLNKRLVLEHASDDLVNETESETQQDGSLDDDWLNYFEEYAEKASTEEVRKLWGRVLAGEIRNPKTYSLRALRFLSELDRETARLFERVSKNRLNDLAITRLDSLSGKPLLEALELEEVGLLQDVSTGISRTFDADGDGKITISLPGYIVQFKPKNSTSFRLNLIKISKVGQELLSLLEPPPYGENALALLEHLIEKKKLTWGLVGQITRVDGDMAHFNIVRVWEEPVT